MKWGILLTAFLTGLLLAAATAPLSAQDTQKICQEITAAFAKFKTAQFKNFSEINDQRTRQALEKTYTDALRQGTQPTVQLQVIKEKLDALRAVESGTPERVGFTLVDRIINFLCRGELGRAELARDALLDLIEDKLGGVNP